MDRRDLLKIGATAAAAPALAQHAHPTGSATMQKSGVWTPAVFTAEQNATVIALVDLIIPATDTPGAKDALVNMYIDRFLEAGPEAERERFLGGLKLLDQRAGGAFLKLSPQRQVALLEELDRAPDTDAGNQFFRMLKSMTSRLYYQTQAGFKELNKGGMPQSFGCTHPNHKK